MTEFDPDKVEWPQKGFAHPAYEHKMPPGSDHPANVAMYYDPPLVVPAEALRQAAERIKELEASWESLRIEAQRREAELTAPLPLEVTDEMVERGARAFWEGISASLRGSWSSQNITVKDRYRHLTRACLSAALTQKGEPRACTGCANGCAGCKGKGKPYGEELMRQLRQGQKGDNE